jgi:hypothetical protein
LADDGGVYDFKGASRSTRLRWRIVLMTVSALVATLVLLLVSCCGVKASAPVLFKPTSYEVVPGFFAQSLNSTKDTTFDFVSPYIVVC